MADTTAFIVEAVIVLFFSVIVSSFCVRQLYYDITHAEKLRPLIVCHYLIAPACVLQIIGSVDPQGGFGVYSEAFSVFCGQLRTMILLSAAQALAVGFVSSYQLMTQGASKQLDKNTAFFTLHATIIGSALILFLVQMFTRNVPIGIVSRSIMSLYSILVSLHTIYSAYQVRKVLKGEHARTGKYSEGIRKLGRVMILVAVLMVIGNSTMMVTMKGTIELVQETHIFPEPPPKENFAGFNVFSDCAGLLALTALITGSWNVRPANSEGGNNSKPTPPAATSQGRKSTLKVPSSRTRPSDTSTETSLELATITPPNSYVNPPSSSPLQMEDSSPASSDAISSRDDDSSKKRRGNKDYEQLDV